MGKGKTCLIAVLLILVILFGLFVFLPAIGITFFPMNTLAVQFYDDVGNPVGKPLSAFQLGFEKDGQTVASFTTTVSWSTNDPSVTNVFLDIVCDVYAGDDQDPTKSWVAQMNCLVTAESYTCSEQSLDTVCAGVPVGSVRIRFSGAVYFLAGTTEVAKVDVTPVACILDKTGGGGGGSWNWIYLAQLQPWWD